VAELAALSAGAGVFPIEAGGVRAVERVPEAVWSAMPLGGGRPDWWPEPGRIVERPGLRAVWFGRDAAMVEGARPAGVGAVTDQTDAWVVVRLEGEGAQDVLARLVPIDLREVAFPAGSVARTVLGHLNVAVLRHGRAFEVWAFRSMAGTLAHDLDRAMRGVAARGAG
jgi:sarcosine oxidase subunit gamma